MTGISERDWEDLSAYLDGQLTPQEKARFERSLQTRVDLQTAMGDLKRTRTLLRKQPAIRAPRNFTLSSKFIASHKRRSLSSGLFKTMRLASAVASLLFMIVLLGDLFIPRAGAVLPMAAKPEESLPIEQAVQDVAPLQVQESVEETVVVEMEKEVERASEAGIATPDVGTTLEMPMVKAQPFTPTELTYPSPEEIPAPAESAKDESIVMETPVEMLPEEGFKEPEIPGGESFSKTGAPEFEKQVNTWNVWRILEIGLAVVGLTAGIIALFLRYSGRA